MEADNNAVYAGPPDPAVVAAEIRQIWAASGTSRVEAIVLVGQKLAKVKAGQQAKGEFRTWVKAEFHSTFRKNRMRTVLRFMAIARNPVLADATHASHLPSAWGTLHLLSLLREEVLAKKIADGQVTPKTTREDVRRMLLLTANKPAASAKARAGAKGAAAKAQLKRPKQAKAEQALISLINVDPSDVAPARIAAWIRDLEGFCAKLRAITAVPIAATVSTVPTTTSP
jgi:hypothetical protein